MFIYNKKKTKLNNLTQQFFKKSNTTLFKHSFLLIITFILIISTSACSLDLYEPNEGNSNSLKNTIEGTPSQSDTSNDDIQTIKEEEQAALKKLNDEIMAQGKEAQNQTTLLEANSIDLLIKSMTLEQKIAQLFIVDFYGMTNEYQLKDYTVDIHNFLKEYPVGGVIYFAENISTKSKVIELNQTFQNDFAIPLFISVDEEGGLVSRLGKADIGVTHLTSASELSALKDSDIQEKAYELGLQMKELGFNMDFAPVLDVNTNPDNPIIGTRSFNSDPTLAAKSGVAFSNGLIEAGIISSGKHFPGHGDTSTDSHLDLTIINHDIDRLRTIEFVPFQEAIANDIPTIMMGHINTPNLEEKQLPASLSPYMITTILRDELGFEGLVLTDSLRMKAITDFYDASDIGVMLIKAGGDIILIPDNFEETYNGLLDAVNSGDISIERINESVKRILTVKKTFGILTF